MRRYISALLVILLITPAALGESYAFRWDDGAAAVDETGAVLIPAGTYESVIALNAEDGSLAGYAAGVEADGTLRYAILSPAGERLTEFLYSSVEAAGGSFICGKGGAYRIVSAAGVEGENEYGAIAYAGDGAFLTISGNVSDEIADPLVLLAKSGINWQLGINVLYGLGTFSEDLMPVCDGASVRFGYIGRDGSWKIPAQYEYAGDFEDGYAVVTTGAGYGVIDSSGGSAVEPDCDLMERNGDLILALKEGTATLYRADADRLSVVFQQDAAGASPRLSGSSVVFYGDDAVTVLDENGHARFTLSPTASVSEAGGLYVIRDGDWAQASAYLAGADGVPVSVKYNTIRLLEGAGDAALFAYGVTAEDSGDVKFGLMRGDGSIETDAVYDELARVGPGLFCAVTADGATIIDAAGMLIAKFE